MGGLDAGVDSLRSALARVTAELDAAVQRLERSTDWYQQRFLRLRRWVEEEVRPLSAEVANRYYAICANGSPSPHESADWTETMHGLRAELARVTAERDKAAANYRFMVERAADEKLDGYRELGRRAANAEMRADAAERKLKAVGEALAWCAHSDAVSPTMYSDRICVADIDCENHEVLYDGTPEGCVDALLEAVKQAKQ